jgi:hypothetical protein
MAAGDMAADWWCPKRAGVRREECKFCIAEAVAEHLLPVVQQYAAEALNQAYWATAAIPHAEDVRDVIRARAQALRTAPGRSKP